MGAIHLNATPKALTLTLYDRHRTAIDHLQVPSKKR